MRKSFKIKDKIGELTVTHTSDDHRFIKSEFSRAKNNAGFTLIELIVVIAIMVTLYSVLTLNLAGNRTPLNLKIAANQLVTNIRETQSFTLSSRLLPSGQSAEYYLIKFDLSQPTQYTIQAIYNASSQAQLVDVQTINLPPNIRLASSSPIVISNPGVSGSDVPPSCGLASFSTPYAQILFNDGCYTSLPYTGGPYTLQSGDDYEGFLNLVTSTSCASNPNVPCADSLMTIKLTDVSNTISREVLINGITGVVCPTNDGATCAASY